MAHRKTGILPKREMYVTKKVNIILFYFPKYRWALLDCQTESRNNHEGDINCRFHVVKIFFHKVSSLRDGKKYVAWLICICAEDKALKGFANCRFKDS
jgi:hypothetical protein